MTPFLIAPPDANSVLEVPIVVISVLAIILVVLIALVAWFYFRPDKF